MKVHFISIGGSVMHQLAIALKRKGYHVTGTDDEIFEPAKSNLINEGLMPEIIGWNTNKITTDLDAVILGMHAKADNPEIAKAKELGLKIYSFPEYIYAESTQKKRVVVGGSHGKTTTTSMIMHVLNQLNFEFDYLVGAKLEGFNQSVNITHAPIIVCEGDEYPASVIEKKPKFHFLFPHVAILTGIAWDHINVFPTFNFYLEQFVTFIHKIEPGGILIYNEGDTELKKLVEANQRQDINYQPYSTPENAIEGGKTTVVLEGEKAELSVFGNHNLQNVQAAYWACKALGVSTVKFLQSIASFTGASKRLELLASHHTMNVYRDFAHAPSKVKATVQAVKQQFPNRKLVAILELHTFSSLNEQFMKEYNGALANADAAIVFYSNHALELKRMPPLAKQVVLSGFAKENLLVMNQKNELVGWLNEQNFTNTSLLFMSSGNYDGFDVVEYANALLVKEN